MCDDWLEGFIDEITPQSSPVKEALIGHRSRDDVQLRQVSGILLRRDRPLITAESEPHRGLFEL